MSQTAKILDWLKRHPETGMTQADAIEQRDIRCYRLAARIAELRERGHHIVTRMEDGHARYFLHLPPENEQRALWGDR